jgi:hypothetical protein
MSLKIKTDDLIWIETMMGNKYPARIAVDAENTACLMSIQLKVPCKVVRKEKHESS